MAAPITGRGLRSIALASRREAPFAWPLRSPGHIRSLLALKDRDRQDDPAICSLRSQPRPHGVLVWDGDLRIEIVAVLQRRARATLASREHAPVHRIASKPTRHATPGRARSPGSRSIASITNCLAPAAPLRSEHRLGALCTLPAGASAP
jgi:hypothetical protein